MGVMVASFAHDVRNVFNSIKLSAETVESKSDSDQSIQDYAENIKEDCDRINQLMESVLSFSSSIEDNLQTLDIIFLLQQLIERWNPKLERAKVKCVLQFEKEVPLISADPRSLEQVFNNLFSNARDAMDQTGGTLGVYISKKESKVGSRTVVIKISDSGPGIPEEFKTKIFDPYFSSRPGGTGLGLAITKRIVELHHGQIEVDSFPGGTTFAVTFPEKSTEITNQ
jgi:signal transduction histidine kinase